MISEKSDAVGGVVHFGMTTHLDYPGWNPDDPVDLSTGYYGYNGVTEPIEPRWIEIHGEYEVTSQLTHYVQEIQVALFPQMMSETYGEIDAEMYFDPDVMIYSNLGPGENQSQNFTLHVLLDQNVPAGEVEIEVSGTWQNQPGVMGGDIPLISSFFIHVAPVVSAYFDDHIYEIELREYDLADPVLDLVVNGNDYMPPVAVRLLDEDRASKMGITLTGRTGFDPDSPEREVWVDLEIISNDSPGGSSIDLEIELYDFNSSRVLDDMVLTIEIIDDHEPPGDPDDDIPTKQPDVDSDADEVELLDSSCCQKEYEDREEDEIYLLGSLYSYEYEIGSRPQVDARSMNVWRENEDLHIKVLTGKTVEGWTTMMVYILPDDDHKQRDYYEEDLEDASFLEYEPAKVLASNDLFAKGGYWPITIERSGNSITAVGSLSDLMDYGLDEDFEVFVQLVDLDPALLMMDDIYELEIEMVVDYIGCGAGNVKDDSTPDDVGPSLMIEPGDIGGLVVKTAIGSVVIFIAVILIIFVVVKVSGRKKKST